MGRRAQIEEIAKSNAMTALDQIGSYSSRQEAIDAYEQNMRDTVAEQFPDYSSAEAGIAEHVFFSLTK